MSTSTSPVSAHSESSVSHSSPGDSPSHPVAAVKQMLRFMVRRDRLRAPIWVLGIIGIWAAMVGSVVGLYHTPSQLLNYAEISQADAAFKAITGPGYGLDNPTQGAVVMNEGGIFALIGFALMCLFMIIRHTRMEEDSDRAELVRSAPVGRYATLTAACLWVGVLNLVSAVGVTVVLIAYGLPAAGSLAYGLAAFGLGMLFVGVGAVAAQVATRARSATAIGGATLGAAFLLRAVGDLGNEWARWLSPLGWAQGIRVYADERWWVLLLLAATAAILIAGALVLSARRDLGAGFLRQRPGAARGSSALASPLAMAIRLQRGTVIGWAVGIGIFAFFFGLVADQADSLLENKAIADVLAQSGQGSPTDSFLATVILLTALLTSGFTVSSVLRLRSEELGGHAESTIAAPVSRQRWAASHLVVSLAGSAVILVAAGLATGLGYAVQVGDAGEILPLLGAALNMVPALLVLAGLGFALFGLRARLVPLVWIAVALSAAVGLLAETLNLPQWVRDLSPFEHVPALPAASFDQLPVAILTAIAAALASVGLWGVGRRNIG